jgi:hypothetical protein
MSNDPTRNDLKTLHQNSLAWSIFILLNFNFIPGVAQNAITSFSIDSSGLSNYSFKVEPSSQEFYIANSKLTFQKKIGSAWTTLIVLDFNVFTEKTSKTIDGELLLPLTAGKNDYRIILDSNTLSQSYTVISQTAKERRIIQSDRETIVNNYSYTPGSDNSKLYSANKVIRFKDPVQYRILKQDGTEMIQDRSKFIDFTGQPTGLYILTIGRDIYSFQN